MTKEQAVFQKYLKLLTEQQSHLVHNDPESTSDNTDKINALAREAADLENRRREILSRLTEQLDAGADEMNISRLIAIFKGQKFRDLEGFKDAMLETHKRINSQKAKNDLLVERSIEMISQNRQLIRAIKNPGVSEEDQFPESVSVKDD